jgi:hypothetical protein
MSDTAEIARSKPPASDFGAPWIKIKSKSIIKDQM